MYKDKITIFFPLLLIFHTIGKISSEDYVQSSKEFFLPFCLSLLNGNNIMIYKYGIIIFESNFLSPIYQYNFTSNNTIVNRDSLDKVAITQFTLNYEEPIIKSNINEKIKSEDSIIIVLVEGNIYFLSSNGEFLFTEDLSDLFDTQFNTNYNLVSYKIDSMNKYYYYFIIFGYKNDLNILYYKFDLKNKRNIQLSKNIYKINGSNNVQTSFCEDTFNSHIMPSFDYDHYLLLCFGIDFYPNEMQFLYFNINNAGNNVSYIKNKYETFNQTLVVKSKVNYYKNLTYICYIDKSKKSYCVEYFLNEEKFGEIVSYFSSCTNYYTGLNFVYIHNLKQYSLSCHQTSFIIYYSILDENFKPIQNLNSSQFINEFKLNGCYGFTDISIIFDKYANNYSIIFECYYNSQYILQQSYLNLSLNYTYINETDDKNKENNKNETIEIIENKNYYINNGKKIYVEKCPNEHPFEIVSTKECVNICTFEDLINGYVKSNELGIEKTYNIIHDYITRNISNISSNNEIIIKCYNTLYQITTTTNQNNDNYNENISVIHLNECEDKLKTIYSIPKDLSLIIFKIDIKRKDSLTTEVEYEVYSPVNKTKLNLSYCNDTIITIYTPIEMNKEMINIYDDVAEQGYNIYDSNSSFYNEICTRYKSKDGSDVSLNDRKIYYYDDNLTLCENSCKYIDINTATIKVHCECNVKTSVNTNISKPVFNISSILESFYSFSSYNNLKIIKCFKLVFSKIGQTYNYCSYIAIIIVIAFSIIMIFSLIKGLDTMKLVIYKLIKKLLSKENFMQKIKKNIPIDNDIDLDAEVNIKHRYSQKSKKTNKLKIKSTPRKLTNISQRNIYLKHCPPKHKASFKKKKLRKNKTINLDFADSINKINKTIFNNSKENNTNLVKYAKNKIKINGEENQSNSGNLNKKFLFNKEIYKNSEENESKENKEIKLNASENKAIINDINDENKKTNLSTSIKNSKDNKEFISVELNNMDYEEAIKKDNRTFYQYYKSLLFHKQLILFTFVSKQDYNIPLFKINLFLLILSISLIVNAFFYSDNTMHKIYIDRGSYNFIYQIPKTILSSLISFVMNSIFRKLSLSQINIINLKKQKNVKLIGTKVTDVLYTIKIKMIIFNVIGFLFLVIFWYYLAAFGAVYNNTQTNLLIDTSISFIIQMIYPFVLNLFPAILRIFSLRDKNHKKKLIYKISQIISLI